MSSNRQLKMIPQYRLLPTYQIKQKQRIQYDISI